MPGLCNGSGEQQRKADQLKDKRIPRPSCHGIEDAQGVVAADLVGNGILRTRGSERERGAPSPPKIAAPFAPDACAFTGPQNSASLCSERPESAKSAMRKQAVQQTVVFGLRTRTWAADLDKDEVIHTQLAELLFEGGLDVGREMRLPQHRGAPYSAATQHQLTPNARLPRSASDRFRTPRFLVVSEILQTSQICQCCPVWTAGHLPWLCGVPGSALDAMTLRPSPSVRDS